MTRVRQLLLGLASGSAFYSGVVPALGLGEITLHSALNQPLEAEIELLQVADLSADDLAVRLASAAVFQRSGVDRLVFLNDLRFTPLLRGGSSVIRVVSSQPVREPYLNFIVEVARPNGQLLREYTVLLDPPGSAAFRTLAVASPAPARAVRADAPAAFAAPAALPPAELGQRYRVASGDSLWKIAARLRAAGSLAAQQTLMRDIQALNPQAFSNGDSNRLQTGAELLLPDAAAAPGAPAQDLASAASPVASGQAPAPSVPPLDPQVEMIAQAQRRVDRELASQAAENAQLQQSLSDLQAQLQRLQAQMHDKDRQLAALQAQLAERQAPPQVLPAPGEQTPEPVHEAAAALDGGRLAAVGAALLLALAGVFALFRRGRRRAAAPDPAEQPAPAPEVLPIEASRQAEPEVAAVRVAQTPRAPAVQSAASTDALEGANIYIAYGRLGEAATILRKALQGQPRRSDIRFRLLEVLAQQGAAQEFLQEEALLREAGFTAARIDQLKARYPALLAAATVPLDEVVLELGDESPEPPAAGLVDEDFQLNLDDLSLDADWDLVSPFSPATRKQAARAPVSMERDDLPAAYELGGERDARSPFAESMLVEEASADSWLENELHEAFAGRAQARDGGVLGDLDRLAGNRDNLAKLNLALAYIEQGNVEGACNILNEVISEGDDQQRREARALLARIA